MEQIYSTASCVIAWLGLSNPTLDRGLPIFLAEQRCSLLQLYLFPPAKDDVRDVLLKFKSDYSPPAQAALEILSTNPYWSRSWIIQELILANHPVIWYGDSGVLSLDPLRDWRGPHPPGTEVFQKLLWFRNNTVANVSLPLLMVVQTFHSTHCADPRDKVYAFLSIARDKDTCGIEADYTKPLDQLHEELVRYCGGQHAQKLAEVLDLGKDGYDKTLDAYVLPEDPHREDKSREQISLTLSGSGSSELDWSMMMNQHTYQKLEA